MADGKANRGCKRRELYTDRGRNRKSDHRCSDKLHRNREALVSALIDAVIKEELKTIIRSSIRYTAAVPMTAHR